MFFLLAALLVPLTGGAPIPPSPLGQVVALQRATRDAASETEETRAAATRGLERLERAAGLRAKGDDAAARAVVAEALAELHAVEGGSESAAVAGALEAHAVAAGELGLRKEALRAWEAVHAWRERQPPVKDLALLRTKARLAEARERAGDLAGARALEPLFESLRELLPEDDPDRLAVHAHLARTTKRMGDLAEALLLQRSLLASYERVYPPNHPATLHARESLSSTLKGLGRLDESIELARSVLSTYERARPADHPDLLRARRNLAKTLRLKGALAETRALEESLVASYERLRPADHPDLVSARANLANTLRRMGELERAAALEQSVLAALERTLPPDHPELARARANLASRKRRSGGHAGRDSMVALGTGDAWVSYGGSERHEVGDGAPPRRIGRNFHADVITHDAIVRLDLGRAQDLEELAEAWLAAAGVSRKESRVPANTLEPAAGARLRERILDPVLARTGATVRRLFVSTDDPLLLLPLDALPLDAAGSERVGDRVRVVMAHGKRLDRALGSGDPVDGPPSLLVLGDVDYDAERGTPAGKSDAESGAKGTARFEELVRTRAEVELTTALFRRAFDVEPTLLTRERATKEALYAQAPGKRHVHMATRGFGPERAVVTLPVGTVAKEVVGVEPLSLCGLALTGANHGGEAGVLTAKELASLDLSQCELFVLTAPAANLGIHRAGFGIHSLRAAVHAAGARASLTPLWGADDEATLRLLELFYTNLWHERMGTAEALWQAKRTLREEGTPVRDWAGWMLTDDPR